MVIGDDMPNSTNSNYVNKPFMLNLDDPDEKKLYEWLSKQPRRSFKKETKQYWLEKMKQEEQE